MPSMRTPAPSSLGRSLHDQRLQQAVVESYDFDRMVVQFTMLDGDNIIQCAITTAAMDDLEGSRTWDGELFSF